MSLEFDAAIWLRNNYHLYDNIGATCDALEIQLRNAKAKQELQKQVTTLPVEALECLQDVISHHRDFVDACWLKCGVSEGTDDESYWMKQVKVLDRMKAQAEHALLASQPSAQPLAKQESEWINDPHDIEQGMIRNPKYRQQSSAQDDGLDSRNYVEEQLSGEEIAAYYKTRLGVEVQCNQKID